jgi:hypothetical protein
LLRVHCRVNGFPFRGGIVGYLRASIFTVRNLAMQFGADYLGFSVGLFCVEFSNASILSFTKFGEISAIISLNSFPPSFRTPRT